MKNLYIYDGKMEDEKEYCKYCGVELNDSNWTENFREDDVRICKVCQMKMALKEGYLKIEDKTLANNLDLLEKLGFDRGYILTHFFTYGKTNDRQDGNYYIWTYKAEQGVLKGAVLELWFHSKTWKKSASLFLPNGQKYIKISLKRLEEILNDLARRYL